MTFAVIALVAFAAPARADLALTVVDSPTSGGSWWQSFAITGGTFDRVTVGGVTPDSQRPWNVENVVRNPAGSLDILSTGGSGLLDFADIRGTDMASLAFDMHFADTYEDSWVSFNITIWDYTKVFRKWLYLPTGTSEAVWKNGEWSVCDFCMDLDPVGAPLPMPGAVLLGLLGLVVAGRKLRQMC
jgi:hypothetical protein